MRKFILVFFIIFSGCKATKTLDSKSTVKKISTNFLVEKTENNKSAFDYLVFRS